MSLPEFDPVAEPWRSLCMARGCFYDALEGGETRMQELFTKASESAAEEGVGANDLTTQIAEQPEFQEDEDFLAILESNVAI